MGKCRFAACGLAAFIFAAGLLSGGRQLTALADGASAASGASAADAPAVTAETAAVIDADTFQIYYQKDMHRQMYPASITKIMTGLLAVEDGRTDDVVTVPADVGKSQSRDYTNIALRPGEQLTQEQLLYTMFLASANDCAQVLAEHIGGSVDNFVSMMNYRARQLGATDTHFDNPNGLPDTNNVTSAYDMALIASQAVKLPELVRYFGAVSYTLQPTNMRNQPEQYTTLVKMLRPTTRYYYPGIIAAKSGWIVASGYTLVTAATRDGRTVVCVVMKSASNVSVMEDSEKLLDYAFSQPQATVARAVATNSLNVSISSGSVSASSRAAARHTRKAADTVSRFVTMLLLAVGAVAVLIAAVILMLRFRDRRRQKAADMDAADVS